MDAIYPGFSTGPANDPNGLFASDHPVYLRAVTLVEGQNLEAGALLGRITTGGKFTLSLADAGDGSQTPVGVLLGDMDATLTDKTVLVAFAGGFKQQRITYGEGHNPDTVWAALAARRIYLYDELNAGSADTTAPAGYAIAFAAASYQLGVDADAIKLNVTGAEIGGTFEIELSSSGGGTPVEEEDDVEAAAFDLEGVDGSGLTAGTMTARLVVIDADGNRGYPVFATATLEAAG